MERSDCTYGAILNKDVLLLLLLLLWVIVGEECEVYCEDV